MRTMIIYVIGHCLMMLAMVIGITVCAIHFDNYNLLWWYLVPAICGGLNLKVKTGG